jgi:hypothetical protein
MKNKILIILIILTAIFLVLGCSKKQPSWDSDYAYTSYMGAGETTSSRAFRSSGVVQSAPMAMREMSVQDDMGASGSRDRMTFNEQPEEHFSESGNVNNERKLVKRANVRIRVENLDTIDASVNSLMEKYNAYAASTNIDENSRYYSLRVPAQYYEIFLTDMNGLGRQLHRYESTEDVTLRYYDLEGRLNTKKELLRTFQAYLGRANNIEEILAVEARIADLQYDIEGTGIQLRNLSNRVEYATIDLNIIGPVTSIPKQTLTFAERLKELFGGFGGFLSSLVVVIIGIVIYGIPILLLLGLLFWVLFGRIGLMRKLWRVLKKAED